jgi:hypothetical protein
MRPSLINPFFTVMKLVIMKDLAPLLRANIKFRASVYSTYMRTFSVRYLWNINFRKGKALIDSIALYFIIILYNEIYTPEYHIFTFLIANDS